MSSTTSAAATTSLLEEMAAAAVLAPSSHNTQPWLLRLAEGGSLELYADRTRALPVNDPWDRELTISCGCALLNARAAAAHHGAGAAVELLPDGEDSDLLARLTPMPGRVSTDEAALYPAIGWRHTDRRAFAPHPVVAAHCEALVGAADAEGAWLEVLSRDRRAALAELVAEGDRRLFGDPHWRRELAAWMHPRRTGDGLPYGTLAGPPTRFTIRHFDVGEGQARRDLNTALDAPLVAILGTRGDEQTDWLAAGQALERALLVAAGLGLQASFLNQPIQVPALRPDVGYVAGHDGFAQVVLRIGHPREPAPAAPRRPLADVLIAV